MTGLVAHPARDRRARRPRAPVGGSAGTARYPSRRPVAPSPNLSVVWAAVSSRSERAPSDPARPSRRASRASTRGLDWGHGRQRATPGPPGLPIRSGGSHAHERGLRRRPVAAAGVGRDVHDHQPGHGGGERPRREGRRAGRRRRGPGRPPRLRSGPLAPDGRRRAGAGAVEARRPDQRQSRRDGAARERQHREDALRLREGGAPVRGGGVPLLRRLDDEDPRGDAQPSRWCVHLHAPAAGGRRRRDRPLELPVPARLVEDRPRAGGREHGRPEARLAHALDRAPLRRARRRRRGSPRACSTW